MEIHAPEGPTKSFKDFAIHIVIVTIGILIALGLEGVRESIHEHRQIAETREILHDELTVNRQHLVQQREALKGATQQLDAMLANLDEWNRQPGALAKAMDGVSPGFYFFTTSSWETALSTGVLDHMSPAEVHRFSETTISVRDYVNIQDQAVQRFYEVEAIFHARPTLAPAQLEDGRQKLMLMRFYFGSMNHLLEELAVSMDGALRK